MATFPTPRSYSQMLGSMLNAFLSRARFPKLKKGDPSLSLLEAAAQSDFRNSQEVLRMLSLRDLQNVSGTDLDAVGRDEKVARIGQSASTGSITVRDSSFSKVSSTVSSGTPAGSSVVLIANGTGFSASGSVYLGRGTSAVEGPLAYSSIVDNGSYWTITLSTPTSNYHSVGETVVLSQGGSRTAPSGAIVRTGNDAAGATVQFRIEFDATIPDGETEITGVAVECLTSGLDGNIAEGAITSFVSAPFTGAVATNPLPFVDGTAVQTDDDYRESIRLARKSRAKATAPAIVSGLVGARASDESGQILSVNTSARPGEPKTVTIDNGTGYEPKYQAVGLETLTSSAVSGEQFFSLSNRPVAKARVVSGSGPFVAVPGDALTVFVDGEAETHTFAASDFFNPDAAVAYEIVASINANPTLSFSARTEGSAVALLVKAETGENLQVHDSGANSWLSFGGERQYSLNLFLNDRRLDEDGKVASIETVGQGSWGIIQSGDSLTVTVDGVTQTVTVSDVDFMSLTSFPSVSRANSLASWATVLKSKLAGIDVVPSGLGTLVFSSKSGRSNEAEIAVTAGVVATAMFGSVPVSDTGKGSDYVFDRFSGQIRLASPLAAGDRLTAGATETQAFVETSTLTVAANTDLWFAVDGGATVLSTGLGIGSSLAVSTASSPAWGKRLAFTATGAWTNAQEGDWIVFTDSAFASTYHGAFMIAERISSDTIHIERAATAPGAATANLAQNALVLVRSTVPLQKVTVASGTYSPTSLAATISVSGATTSVTTSSVRVKTNSPTGDICIVHSTGTLFADVGVLKTSEASYEAALMASNEDTAVPSFDVNSVSAVTSSTQFTAGTSALQYVLAKFLRPDSDGANQDRQSNKAFSTAIQSGTTALTVRSSPPDSWLVGNRLFYSRGFDTTARDSIGLLVDGDSVGGSYTAPLYRRTQVVSWGGTLTLRETDGTSLAKLFGTSYDWRDYALMFKSRTKTHLTLGADTNKTVLWRWWQHGPEGDDARLQYQYPLTANTPVTVETNNVTDVTVRLRSGGARSVPTFRSTAKLGVAITALSSSLYTYQFVSSFVASLSRVIRINYTGISGGPFVAGAITIGAATATVVSDGGGYIVVTGIVGTITSGNAMTQGGTTATTASAPYGYTTATLTLPGAVTNHGIATGEVVYATAGGSFSAGPRTVAAVTATTLSYVDDAATTTGPSASSISVDLTGEVTANGTSVVTGDVFSLYEATALPSVYKRAVKVTMAAGNRSWTGQHYEGQTPSTTLAWYSVTGASFYPLVSTTAADVASAIPAGQSVTAVAVGTAGAATATGVIDAASYEATELGGASPWYELGDGYNWVQAHTTPATTTDNFVFTLRNALTGSALTSNADLANEDVRLVPVTANGVAQFLSSTAVSGFGSRGGAWGSRNGAVVLMTNTGGSASSILVTGGSGNSASAAVVGTASGAVVNTTASEGLGGLQYVWAQNVLAHDKPVFDATTTLSSIDVTGAVVLANTGPKAWTRIGSLVDNNATYVEKQGDFVALHPVVTTSVSEGDWLRIQSCTTPPSGTTQVSPQNTGLFQVVRVSGTTVWIENSLAVEERAGLKYDFIAFNSVVPGDSVSFGTTLWGSNVGSRTVTALGATEWEFTLQTSVSPLEAVSGPLALGSAYSSFRVTAGSPAKLLKRVLAIAPATTGLSIKLDSSTRSELISEAYGTSLTAINKLGLATSTAMGSDAYVYHTGLIAEASKIVFGDESDPVRYPGIATAGASYLIDGAVRKRIKMAVVIRTLSGATSETIRTQVQSAIAAAINRSPHGKSISISSLVTAAGRVNGVRSVAVASPVYSTTSDLLTVQPHEKAYVFALSDISVSFVGE